MPLQLLDLPSELIISIAERAPLTSTLTLRRTCKALAEICDFPLQDQRKRLYLHPRSIAYAIDFCHHEQANKWRDGIEEIIILGRSTPDMRTRDMGPGLGVHGMLDFRLDFHAWDQWPKRILVDGSVGLGKEVEYQDLVDTEENSFGENYETLISGLANLPALRTIRYAGSTQTYGLGFCGVSDQSVSAKAEERKHWQSCFGNEGKPTMRWALRTVWWSDAHVFAGILGSEVVGGKFEMVDISQPFPAVKRYNQGIRAAPTLTQEALYVPNLGVSVKELSIWVPGGQGWVQWLLHLVKEMRQLEKLGIQIQSRREEQAMRLWQQDGGELSHETGWEEDLALRLGDLFKGLGRTLRLRECHILSLGSVPLLCDLDNLITLLEGSQGTLKKIVLGNVLFLQEPEVYPRIADVRVGLKKSLGFSRETMGVESVMYKISHFEHSAPRALQAELRQDAEISRLMDLGDLETLLRDFAKEANDWALRKDSFGFSLVSANDLDLGRSKRSGRSTF